MATIKITDENFEELVLKSEKPFYLKFGAEWCSPCKFIQPHLDSLSDELKDKVTFGTLDVDNDPNTGTKYGIRSLPTMILFKGSKNVGIKVGATSKEDIKNWLMSKI